MDGTPSTRSRAPLTSPTDAANKTHHELLGEIAELRARLAEPEETLYAIRHGEVDAFVVFGAAGEQVYTLGTPELLRQLHLITDALPMLVSYIDRDGCYRFNNRQYEAWFGRPLHELAGLHLAKVMGEAAYEAVREHVCAALEGRRAEFERWLPLRDAGERCVQATLVPHLQDGEVKGYVAFIADVTERKRAEEALRLLADAGKLLAESLDGEHALARAARLAAPALADWCTIDLVNDGGGGERVASVHADPARQPLMEELKRFPPDWEGSSLAARVLRSGEPALLADLPPEPETADDQARILRRLAARSWLSVPLLAHGRTLGVWSFAYAESGRRYQERDLAVAQELAYRAALALDNSRLYRQADEASRAKDKFLANLSHELRTPLTPVLAMVARLEVDSHLPAGVRAGLDLIRRNVELEARLIDDLLDLTRISRGQLELHAESVDLERVIRQALETCDERLLAARRIDLDLAAPKRLIWGDPSRLVQVFWNLFNNALKFTPAGGWIRVRSYLDVDPAAAGQPPAPCLVAEVSDSGLGIEPDALAKIFATFHDGVQAARRFGGLGLGLGISKAIVELHGGRLTAASGGRDKGSTFTCRLPLQAPPAAGERPAEASLAKPRPGPGVNRPLHILLVEDHADSATAMADLLGAMGHQVTVTGTVAAALAAAERGGLDLVLSDLGLPDGDGCELMRQLASRHRLRGIALSGYGMVEDVAKSHEAGFAFHLTKPVNLKTLRAALRRATRPSGQ